MDKGKGSKLKLKPFFPYFGGKYRSANKYPSPLHGKIIEPFAGSAGYSVRHADLDVTLVELNPAIASIWDYLIKATVQDIMSLPTLQPGQSVDDFILSQEAKCLIGMWVNPGSAQPKKTMVNWKGSTTSHLESCRWSENIKRRLADQVQYIRHWKIICGDYRQVQDNVATWFIDPPYYDLGKYYPKNCRSINYTVLADWCCTRSGQVIVCENTGATWLPFEHLADVKGKHTVSKESMWYKKD